MSFFVRSTAAAGSRMAGPIFLHHLVLLVVLVGAAACGEVTVFEGGLDGRPKNDTCHGDLAPPERLSEHPCFEGSPPRPSQALVPFEVRAPLWSDGADKARFVALPRGAAFSVSNANDWELPPGGVLVKEFAYGDDRLETRFITRDSEGAYRFYTYVFDDAQQDGALLLEGGPIEVGGQAWTVPSEWECRRCHTEAAGVSLGLETAQLDRTSYYDRTGREADQLTTFIEIGFVEGLDLEALPPRLPAYDDEAAEVADRARAYLHVNCAHCHRPGGPAVSSIDLRATVSFAGMGICDTSPEFGDPTENDGLLLYPGEPSRSILLHRATTLDSIVRMPPVGRSTFDPTGSALLTAWIDSLEGCP